MIPKKENKLKEIHYAKAGECCPSIICIIDGVECNLENGPLVYEVNSEEGWYWFYDGKNGLKKEYSKNIRLLVPEYWPD